MRTEETVEAKEKVCMGRVSISRNIIRSYINIRE